MSQHRFVLTTSANSAQIPAVKTKARLRRPSALSTARWTSYAIAAGAATVAGTPAAEGEIHYSGLVNFKFDSRAREVHSFPLSQGAALVGIRSTVGFFEHSATFSIRGAAVSNAMRNYPLSFFGSFLALALPRGSVVSQGYFCPFGIGRLQYYNCGFPQWQDPGTWAIGFRFNSGRGTQYGWVRIKWNGCGAGDNKFIVKDYAWGDSGDQIKVGQTQLNQDQAQVTPQSARNVETIPLSGSQGSLGFLALGAVGLKAWRRSRRPNE